MQEEEEGGTFEPHPSTWELLLQYCPESEVDEVKEMLGTSLVEQAIDLHLEVCLCRFSAWL